MRTYEIIGLVALVGVGLALTSTRIARIGDIEPFGELEWFGVGA